VVAIQGRDSPSASGEALVLAARGLASTIDELADRIEADRQLPAALVERLVDAGLFRLLLPRSLGGRELDLPTYVRVVEEVARADASVAWCIGQANGLFNYIANLDSAAARELFTTSRAPVILANGPGQGNQPGRAVQSGSGFRVTGRWMFASGIGHATWLMCVCSLFDAAGAPLVDPDGSHTQRLMLVPRSAATLHDVWHVSGLRGTGSQSFSVTDEFVRPEYAIRQFDLSARREHGPLYLFSNNGFFGPAFGSVALGVAHTSLTAIMDFAAGKIPRGLDRSIRENPAVQAAVAIAFARLNAARSYLHSTLRDVWDAAVRDGEMSVEQRVRVRLASTHATQESVAVVDTAYTLAGSNAIFENLPFERRFRDVHAVSQQLQARRAHYEHVGAYLLGLEPQASFL
jgi:alkylation response protein AidB-like acyl-CoA dehydrogenase